MKNKKNKERVLAGVAAQSNLKKHLRKRFDDKKSVVRIRGSHKEKTNISKEYRDKIDVIDVITVSEIEMLIILAENRYDAYKKAGKTSSLFYNEDLHMLKMQHS